MDGLIIKFLGATMLTSGVMAVALAQGQVPDPPLAKDPLSWAFMTVVFLAVAGAGWVVRFHMTRNVAATDALTSAIDKLVERIDAGFKELGDRIAYNLEKVLEDQLKKERRDNDRR